LNVAIFASAFHPHLGGVEELCRQLAHEYRRRQMGVVVITNRWPRTLPEEELFEGLRIYRLPQRVPVGSLRAKTNYYLTGASIRRKTASILKDNRIDLIHVQCVSANGLYAAAAADSLKLPLVITLQGELTMDAGQMFQRSEFARGMLKRVMDRADIITGCSRKTLEDGQAFYGRPFNGRGHVVFNGARTEDFQSGAAFKHPRPYLFALGRIVPQKGFDVLLKAFAEIAHAPEGSGEGKRLPGLDVDLIIAGDGPELPGLKSLAGELGVGERVVFPGRADRPQTVSYFLGSAAFVLPSRADEGLPVVCAEALAAGKPVVATRSGGAPEAIVHGECGIIVEKEDVRGLAAALREVLSSATLREGFAAKAKARSEQFKWSVIADKYIGIYKDVLQKN
jgi:glycosyltransferase involved in cell wall biosynthesis